MSLEPVFTVYYQCDDQFRPTPPEQILALIRHLIREKKSHFIHQTRPPLEVVIRKLNGLAYVYENVNNREAIVRCEDYCADTMKLICTQEYPDEAPVLYEDLLKDAVEFYYK
jgi:hypothetical protein